MSRDNFTHLHVHDHHSVLDGQGRIEDYLARVKQLGQTHLAQTNHGTLAGAFEFWQKATAAGVTPILGYEAYVAPSETAVRAPIEGFSGQGAYTHMTLLARNATGLRNLYKLHSLAHLEDRFYRKPRVDLAILGEYSEGIIATTGCAGGHIPTLLRAGRHDEAYGWMDKLLDIFGDSLYIEVMDHGITLGDDGDGFDELQLNLDLYQLASDKGAPLVASNDCHYVSPKDAEIHDALLCVQTRAKVADEKRFRFTGSGFYLKSWDEMAETSLPITALANTKVIADQIESYDEVFDGKLKMPVILDGDLRMEVFSSERYVPDVHEDRVMEELAVIEPAGFQDYFLVLADVIAWAKADGRPVGPGRGSAGGSLVAYLLGITDLNPLEHGLLFERFLNPERVSLPDIDIDLADEDRDAVLDYLRERHGVDKVAQIMTLGTVGAKAGLKDATRVLGLPYKTGEELVGYLPSALFGRQPTLSEMPPVEGPERKAAVRLARGLEGLVRSCGVHAAGVVVSPVPLSEVMPTSWKDGVQITGFDAGPVDALGLVKMDFLGLRNLTVLKHCIADLGWTWDDLLKLPLDDAGTYSLLSSGNTDGVFQLDSDGMKRLIKDVAPTRFEDIAAILALYRPGPMGAGAHTQYAKRKRSGRGSLGIDFKLDNDLAGILDETYGLFVYQEQVMRALQVAGGYTLGEADLLRKAMGKKDRDLLGRLKPEFLQRVGANYDRNTADALWAILEPFADYAFNKAHSVGYGLLSYWTAYLKAHYPREYMTALLCSVSGDPDRLGQYLEEVKLMGIPLLPPTVNAGKPNFTHSPQGIHYGLQAIKGFGENAYNKLATVAPFASLDDFFRRAPAQVLNVGVLHSLVRAGALSQFDTRRALLDEQAEGLAGRALEDRKKRSAGKQALFKKGYDLTDMVSVVESVPLYIEWEKEYLGISLSSERVVLVPKRELTEAEWDWVADLVANCPGDDAVFVKIGEALIDTDYKVDRNACRDRLALLFAFDLAEIYVTDDEDTPPWD